MDDLDRIEDDTNNEYSTKTVRARRERSEISRSCRSLETDPPSDAAVYAWHQIRELTFRTYELDRGGFTFLVLPRPQKVNKATHSVGKISSTQSVKASLEHTKMLKSRRVELEMRGPAFWSPIRQERLMSSPHQILAALLQANANHVAIVPPGKKKRGEASAQQTTRIGIGQVGLAATQQQCVVALVCGLAEAAARRRRGDGGAHVANPSCTFETRLSDVLDRRWEYKHAVVVATATESFFAATSLCLEEHDVLAAMSSVAAKELKYSSISNIVPQSTSHVRAACERVVAAKDGSRLWFALVLLVWMASSDVRLHPLLEDAGLFDFDFALADALTRYAKIQIGNRARREFEAFSSAVEQLALRKKVDLDALNGSTDRAWDEEVVDRVTEAAPELALDEIATVVQAVQNTIKSRKSRRTGPSIEMPRAPCAKRVCDPTRGGGGGGARRVSDDDDDDGGGGGDGDGDAAAEAAEAATADVAALCFGGDGGGSDNECDEASVGGSSSRDAGARDRGGKRAPARPTSYTGAADVRDFEKYFCHFMSTMGAEHSCSLKHIVSESVQSTTQSARAVVTSQLKISGVAPTQEVVELSVAAAMNTRDAAAAMLKQKAESCPTIVRWKLRNFAGTREASFVGLNYKTRPPIFLIGSAPRPPFQPGAPTRSKVVWCPISLRAKTIDSESGRGNAFCNACESVAWEGWAIGDGAAIPSQPTRRETAQGERRAAFCSNSPLPTAASGLARSVLTLAATLPVSLDVLERVESVANDLAAAAAGGPMHDGNARERSRPTSHSGSVLYEERALRRQLPHLYPSNPIACGMHVLESVRFAHARTASHQNMVVVPLCPPSERELPLINPDDNPSALLMVHDLKFDDDDGDDGADERADRGRPRCVHTVSVGDGAKTTLPAPVVEKRCVASLTLVADCPMAVPRAARYLARRMLRETGRARVKLLAQTRSLILFAGVQCHTVNEHGRTICSKDMNNSIENTSKIKLPDNHRCPSSTLFQAFVVGHNNVPKQFAGTLWEGAYGAPYDCGSVASIGFGAKHAIADERLPVPPIFMSQQQVDQFTEELAAQSVYRKCNVRSGESGGGDERGGARDFVVLTPSELWGMARAVTPGVHVAARHLCDAFDTLREASGTAQHDTVMSIQALPFSPLTEAVSPVVRHDLWTGFRLPPRRQFTFQADETVKNGSIMNSPLLNACRSNMLHAGSCVCENVYTNVQMVEIACTQLALIGEVLALARAGDARGDDDDQKDQEDDDESESGDDSYADAMDALRAAIDGVFDDDIGGEALTGDALEHARLTSALAFDALVLLNACAPVSFDVGERVVLELFAAAPASGAVTVAGVARVAGLPSEAEDAARRYWRRLGDASACGCWRETAALVRAVCVAARSFDGGFDAAAAAARALEAWVRGLWKLHSDDGVARPGSWSPLHDVESPETMAAADVLNVFVDREEPSVPQKNRKQQRGALFGLANNGFNQLLTLLASSHIPGTRAQYARNEGNMCLRHSCSALKLEANGEKPKAKSTSPVHSDNDWEAFGTLRAKEIQAERQLKAWEINNRLIFDSIKHVHFQSRASGLARGSAATLEKNERATETRATTGALAWRETLVGKRMLALSAARAWRDLSRERAPRPSPDASSADC